MNFIACTDNCIYQKDGECTLGRAASCGRADTSACAYCIPKCPAGEDKAMQEPRQ